MALQTGDLIEIQHYNELALEVNRLYSDTTVGLVWATSNVILNDTAAPGGEAAGATRLIDGDILATDFLVVTVDDLTLLESVGYTINYNTGIITYIDALPGNAVLKVYNRTDHRYGWGQQASIYPIVTGTDIRADEETLQAYLQANTNNLLDKVNIMETRTDGPSMLTRYNKGQIISASDKIIIRDTIDTDILTDENYWKNEVATVSSNFENFTRTTNWDDQLIGEYRYTWDSYNSMRYFFNSGCQLRLFLEMTGDVSNQGYFNWRQVVNDMGTLVIDYKTTWQTGTRGTSENIGAYHFTETYQKVFTSGSPQTPVSGNGPGPGEYGEYDEYGNWTNLVLVWDARITPNEPDVGDISLDVRVVMDDMDMNNTTIGTTTKFGGYKIADDIIDNSATFSMTANAPAITELNNFESGDDS